jgi:hypothetical protein
VLVQTEATVALSTRANQLSTFFDIHKRHQTGNVLLIGFSTVILSELVNF